MYVYMGVYIYMYIHEGIYMDVYMCIHGVYIHIYMYIWERTYILAHLRKEAGAALCEQALETASQLQRFWVGSNSPGSGFLKRDGDIGGRV